MTQFINRAAWLDAELLKKISDDGIPYAEATDSVVGGVLKAAAVDKATDGTDVITQFNALIDALVASGALTEAE